MLVLGATFVLGLSPLASAQEAPYRIVVNGSRPAALTRAQVADYLLKRASTWPDGTAVAPVDLSATSGTRAAVSKQIVGLSVEGVVRYWQQQVFSGRATPPPAKSEDEALALVAAAPGGIGYVGPAGPLPPGVKVVRIAD
jgi:ABC-type phosphate transport system substrate-binding protein